MRTQKIDQSMVSPVTAAMMDMQPSTDSRATDSQSTESQPIETPIEKITFKQCTLMLLEKRFGLQEVSELPPLTDWLNREVEITDNERQQLLYLQQRLAENFRHWNEMELAYGFIGPMMTLVNFSGKNQNFFAVRSLTAIIGNIELSGKPDGMIASGKRAPEQPYFCLQEYKREEDHEGEPAGQALGAMLVAQEINRHTNPVYGCYIKGNIWYFMVLQGVEYNFSNGYIATREDVFDVFRMMKALKAIIAEMIA